MILVLSLGGEDCLEQEMATSPRISAWKIPQTEDPGGLQSMGLQSIRCDKARPHTPLHTHTHTHTHTQESPMKSASSQLYHFNSSYRSSDYTSFISFQKNPPCLISRSVNQLFPQPRMFLPSNNKQDSFHFFHVFTPFLQIKPFWPLDLK